MGDGRVYYAQHEGAYLFKLCGTLSFSMSSALEQAIHFFQHADILPHDRVVIDLTEAESLDSTVIGMVAQIGFSALSYEQVSLLVSAQDIRKRFLQMGFDRFFSIVFNKTPPRFDLEVLTEFTPLQETRQVMASRLKGAHEHLIRIDPKQASEFNLLLEQLKKH